ncbi:sporulation protein YunB [Bacillus sp. 2205SS5-2]|uniref:sporulation protein YunB n=1 Tax=Bacillus sp. 2205SS5-2 TaxID=3109031 RepID=UPI003005B621
MFKQRKRRQLRGPLPATYVFMITFITFSILTFISLVVINRNIEPSLMSIAETKTRQFAAQAINDAISKKISENIDINELIVEHETGGKISYSFNPQIYNRAISEATIRVQKYLDYVESGDLEKLESFKSDIEIEYSDDQPHNGIIYEIPLGMATKNTLLSNLGPRVPVRFEILGAVTSSVDTKIIESGINNTYLEIYIKINVQMNVIIPLSEKKIEISNSVKIGDLFYPGEVPQFYNGQGNGNQFNPIVVPTDPPS